MYIKFQIIQNLFESKYDVQDLVKLKMYVFETDYMPPKVIEKSE